MIKMDNLKTNYKKLIVSADLVNCFADLCAIAETDKANYQALCAGETAELNLSGFTVSELESIQEFLGHKLAQALTYSNHIKEEMQLISKIINIKNGE